jgi:hypothetical protein
MATVDVEGATLDGPRILVTGGRDFVDQALLYQTLDCLFTSNGVGVVIQGGARGADQLARAWAFDRGVPSLSFPAQWAKYGKAAGPRRNVEMLESAEPDVVVAFPGGRGTSHMVKCAHRAGVKVIEVL